MFINLCILSILFIVHPILYLFFFWFGLQDLIFFKPKRLLYEVHFHGAL